MQSALRARSDLDFLSGGGEMGKLIRGFDWSGTELGAADQWPQSLKTSVSTCLNSRFAILIWWGKGLIKLYNDAYAPILGVKHPAALGAPGEKVWPEIWHIIGPMLEGVLERGDATWAENLLLELERNGYPEECYFTFSYSPIRDETGKVAGVFTPVQETTRQVIGERRLRTLRDLAAANRVEKNDTAGDICRRSAEVLGANPQDLPFSAMYLFSDDCKEARLCAGSGLRDAERAFPDTVYANSGWAFEQVFRQTSVEVAPVPEGLNDLPCGAWPVPPRDVVLLPISGAGQRIGFMVVGVSPRKRLDHDYQSFLSLVSGHLSTAIAEAQAFEQERKRAEALAEIDRAKTAFFSNVSHEFRTPLTLMLGPLEQVLGDAGGVTPEHHERLVIAHRNSLRLLRLVNSLLDFSRIEAGRIKASYEPVDLAALTADLASHFRSLMESAALQFIVNCPPLPEPVYVDREMWEKIVLNLLSNAFKYTLQGTVTIALEAKKGRAVLTVSDTGVGIPETELPHLFERFHRVEGANGRTYEGTGIGLALIQELVKLHGGQVEVRSRVGEGSTFEVALPFGDSHLPQERIRAADAATKAIVRRDAFTNEAATWTARNGSARRDETRTSLPRVLFADDNADMRQHLRHILDGECDVVAVSDGVAALKEARAKRPDLIVADVMMPGLDGFGLLKGVREDSHLREVPVILLSARAGEEARTEGIIAGADDYLTKPFHTQELRARIKNAMDLHRLRREARADVERASAQFQTLLNEAPVGVYLVDADFRLRQLNPSARAFFGDMPDLIGRDFDEVLHDLLEKERADELAKVFRHTLETGEPFVSPELSERRRNAGRTEYYEWRINRIPLGGHWGVVCYFRDISKQVQARETIARSEQRFRGIVSQSIAGIAETDRHGKFLTVNDRFCRVVGYTREELLQRGKLDITHPDDRQQMQELFRRCVEQSEPYETEKRYVAKDGSTVWVHNSVSP
ncbi:MAG: PAS domain S-box protein, partial [Acidobacteriaceae bacterium]|nr:PAS domain S-box protein [Acidobacteriaceae bacterium]